MAPLDGRPAPVIGCTDNSIRSSGVETIELRWKLMVFFLALAPRLADLGQRPFWSDEITTAWRAALPLRASDSQFLRLPPHPVYFLLVAPFAHRAGSTILAAPAFRNSGCAGVTLVFLIAARAGGLTSGIVAALIIGLAPTEIAYSQDARSYMLMIFCLLVALHALTGLARSGERAALPWRSGGLGWIWLQFILGSTLALCTLGDSLPWLLASGITALIMVVRARNRSGMLRNFFAAGAICLACCLPLYLVMRSISGVMIHLNMPVPMPALIWYDIKSVYLMRVCDFVSPHFLAGTNSAGVPYLHRRSTWHRRSAAASGGCGGIR